MTGMSSTWPQPLRGLVGQFGLPGREASLSATSSATSPASAPTPSTQGLPEKNEDPSMMSDGTDSVQSRPEKRKHLAFNSLARRLSQAREVALAKASWRPKARGTPVVPLDQARLGADLENSPPVARSSARPPRPPGSVSSPQPQQSTWHSTRQAGGYTDLESSPCPCRGYNSFGFAARPASADSRTSGSSCGSRFCSGTPLTMGHENLGVFHSGGFRCYSDESTPSMASDVRHSLCSACSSSSTPRASAESLGFCPSPSPPPLRLSSVHRRNEREAFCLYASPLDHPPINVRSEVETLRSAFEESGSRVKLNVGVATAGSFTKLLTLARARKGLVLHLSAHAIISDKGEVGLVLEDARGAAHILWRRNLEEILGIREQGLRNLSMLFLSTCWSEELAQVFVECGCRHVISLRNRVHDSAARRFSQHFYLSLGVGQPLLSAWEGARTALRIESEKDLAEQADHFVLFGQHGADEAMLKDICGTEDPNFEGNPTMKEVEDANFFIDMKIPPRPEHFSGRTQAIYEVLHVFGGVHGRRACAIHGPEGIGKSAFGIELSHFAASPGRLFSCAARIIRIESFDISSFATGLEEEFESIASQFSVVLRPASGDSRSSLGSWNSPLPTFRSEQEPSSPRSATLESEVSRRLSKGSTVSDTESLSYLLPLRQRLRRGFQQIEKVRKSSKILLVVDDEVGAVASCSEFQKLLGEILEHTYQLHILICSRAPLYKSLGTTKVVNVPLKGLAEADSAKLFLQRIHRPLAPNDFTDGPDASGGLAGEMSPPIRNTMESAIRRLTGHPLLRGLAGHPGRIRAVSSLVTPGGPTLLELAKQVEDDALNSDT